MKETFHIKAFKIGIYLGLVLALLFCLQNSQAQQQPQEQQQPQAQPNKEDTVLSNEETKSIYALYSNFLLKAEFQKRIEAEKKAAEAEVSLADALYKNRILELKNKYKIDDTFDVKSNDQSIWFSKKSEKKKEDK